MYVAVQDTEDRQIYDWLVEDKAHYIELLQKYDKHRDPRDLSSYINVRPLSE